MTTVESRIANIWGDVLGVTAVDIHANFFDLGGDSLAAVRVVSRIRGEFAVDLTLEAVFTAPTIADLSRAVESAGPASVTPIVPIVPIARESLRDR